jgi:hypothetical protein
MKKLYFLIIAAVLYIPSFAQKAEDTTDGRFHDDLLNHMVGKWDGGSVAHGTAFTMDLFEAGWVMNHQYLRLHFKSKEVVPWIGVPFEAEIFFGYNHTDLRYTTHSMSVHGDNAPFEGFSYAYRTGNEIKIVSKASPDSTVMQKFTWEPSTNTWTMTSNWEIAGKEEPNFLEMKLVAVKPTRR